jgi:hypothetical protein
MEMTVAIGTELDASGKAIDTLSSRVEQTEGKVNLLNKAMDKIMKTPRLLHVSFLIPPLLSPLLYETDKKQWCLIFVLSIVLFTLILIFFKTL